MWTYQISTGRMIDDLGEVIGVGYSGQPQHRNDVTAVALPFLGPIPQGLYRIEPPVNTKTHGPFVLWLDPDPANEMFGRIAFGIHGDSVTSPGSASEGCIIQSRDVREKIWSSGDHDLKVVA